VLLGDRLYMAPISNPKHVLDIATGTGIWPIEFADIWPDANIIGTDLSAIQPENAPPNCTFVKDDAEEPWVFPHTFDYIHLRLVFSCFSNPKKMMKEAFQWMNSGAWIEYQDPSIAEIGSMDDNIQGTAFQKWGLSLIEGIRVSTQGRDIEVAPSYARWLREAGFVDVEEKKLIWPAGIWATDPRMKLAGMYMQRNFMDGAFLATWKALRASGLSHEEAQSVIDNAKKEIQDVKNRFYLVAYVVYGRKP
jgi:SAM-dependent methyltransferase